jgi:L-2-hydroxyglutarate oxidase
MSLPRTDFVVIGGGIVGLATALALAAEGRGKVRVLEAEDRLAAHQSGHNSGVVHSGLYYRPGSLKARLCGEGREAMYRFCDRNEVPFERCGKVVVATRERELPRLEELERRGLANGLAGLARLSAEQIREHEPHARGIAGLWVPQTGVVDFARVARAMAREVRAHGGEVVTGARVTACRSQGGEYVLETAGGAFAAGVVVACAGLHGDRVAKLCGIDPGVAIVPFRGEYHVLGPAVRERVRHLIYPVPDPAFPFLGVHFTRRVGGEVEAGPNAVLALKREGYRRSSFSLRDVTGMAAWPGFWRMAATHWRAGAGEIWRSADRGAFARALQRLVPGIAAGDLEPGGAGVRAMALGRDGRLLDDFHVVGGGRMVHVLNAPSPAATASLSIGRHLAQRIRERVG